MTLAAGSRLGPYEIVAPLGAGGMGEVSRARDTRLDRDVAIKILPVDFAANAQLRARFEREAKTISQLNHPNVCTLFDVGHHNGTDYLVMELIDGKSLADRLLEGPLSIEEVLRHGTEIASALDAAHRRGIIHRDLKPANVMLTKSGAKLLDFGLAKSGPLVVSKVGISELGENPTEHKPLTEQGTILGTFQYMAPEQLEGQEADARSDIFAFGAMLYEMTTGRRAFQGKNKTSLIAAIVSSNPPAISEITPLTPPALDHVIRKCLAKDPEDRWQSIHDVADQLRWISDAGSRAGEAAPLLAKRKTRLRMAWGLHAATAAAAAAVTLGIIEFAKEPPRIVRTSIMPPPSSRFEPTLGAMTLSPDGRRLTFVARADNGKQMVWVRSLDGDSAQPLAGTEEATFPFWSPDSRFIAFFSSGKLKKVDSNGGPPQVLCDATDGRGGSWSPDGKTILFTPTPRDPLFKVASSGGIRSPVTKLEAKDLSHRHPEFLPDGAHFLYLVETSAQSGSQETFGLRAGSLDGKVRKAIVPTDASARYRSGHLLYLRERTLVAQPFDAAELELEGEAIPVAENVTRTERWEASFSLSAKGLLAYHSSPGAELSQVVLVDREGKDIKIAGKPADYRNLALSHDGKRVAVSIDDPMTSKADIWIIDVERGTSTRITFDPEDDYNPVWSPDDRFVYFTSNRQGNGDIFRKSSAGTGADELVFTHPDWNIVMSLSSDGKRAMIITLSKRNDWDIAAVNLENRTLSPLLQSPFNELFPNLSPDGRWLAYHSNESGRAEVYVQRLDAEGGKWQISAEGGSRPRWSRNGREILFLSPDRKLMSADIQLEPMFAASVPRLLFDPRMRELAGPQHDVIQDGSMLVVNRIMDRPPMIPLTLVQNWAEGLER